jgi:hypothetical protein
MQSILVYIIFGLALVYAGWKIYKSVTHKEKAGCSKCEGSGITPIIDTHKRG